MDFPNKIFKSKFNDETRRAFVIGQTGLDAETIKKLDEFGLPESLSEELTYIFSNVLSPGCVELLKTKHDERVEYLETHPNEMPWETHEHEKHLKMIIDETGLTEEVVNDYYISVIDWLRYMMAEAGNLAEKEGIKERQKIKGD